MSINKAILVGNCGFDPEVRYLDGNDANNRQRVARVRLATTERYKAKDGQTKEATEWHTLVFWGRNAEVAEKYVKKGAQLYVEGRIRTRSYTNKSNVEVSATEIVVDNFQLLGKRDANDAPSSTAYTQVAKPAPAPVNAEQNGDDFPF